MAVAGELFYWVKVLSHLAPEWAKRAKTNYKVKGLRVEIRNLNLLQSNNLCS
jgi:hypothetical protein